MLWIEEQKNPFSMNIDRRVAEKKRREKRRLRGGREAR